MRYISKVVSIFSIKQTKQWDSKPSITKDRTIICAIYTTETINNCVRIDGKKAAIIARFVVDAFVYCYSLLVTVLLSYLIELLKQANNLHEQKWQQKYYSCWWTVKHCARIDKKKKQEQLLILCVVYIVHDWAFFVMLGCFIVSMFPFFFQTKNTTILWYAIVINIKYSQYNNTIYQFNYHQN